MALIFAKLYAYMYIYLADHFNINIRGFGFLLRAINNDTVLNVQGRKIYLDSRIPTSYARLIIGRWNEDETHRFARCLAKKFNSISFVDVGANIGEMVTDFSCVDSFKNVLAFEPDPICAQNVEINCALNNIKHVRVESMALSDETGEAFLTGAGTPQAMIVDEKVSEVDKKISIKTLDSFLESEKINLTPKDEQLLMLIDVEGAEVKVLKGAVEAIKVYKPIVIFEYNAVSKKSFNLNDVMEVLGSDYTVCRLNRLGLLDDNLDDTWNCVAVPIHLKEILGVE